MADEHPAVPFRWRRGLPGSGDGTPLSKPIPDNDFYEQLVYSTEHIKGLKSRADLPITAGSITVPLTPGLGPSVDWPLLEKTALSVVVSAL